MSPSSLTNGLSSLAGTGRSTVIDFFLFPLNFLPMLSWLPFGMTKVVAFLTFVRIVGPSISLRLSILVLACFIADDCGALATREGDERNPLAMSFTFPSVPFFFFPLLSKIWTHNTCTSKSRTREQD
jgi:hypothetical protein